MIVAVEGLDGCGKTTVSRLLARMTGGRHVTLPPPRLALTSSALFADFRSDARYLYYLSGVAAVAESATAGEILVADRFVASAHALHLHVSTSLAEQLRRLPLPVPDLTFYLDVDEETRRMRLRDRGTPLDPFEERLATDDTFRERVATHLRSYPATHVISTNGRTPDLVARAAQDIWARLASSGR